MESILQAIEFIGGPGTLWILAGVYFGSAVLERLWALRVNPDYDSADALCPMGAVSLIATCL